MANNDDLSKLNALVGAAIRGLVESGASAESIGAFAATYREEASQVLGITSIAPTPDLTSLVSQAVSIALEHAGVGAQKKTRKPTAQKFYVFIDGRKTSVTISRATTNRLMESKGGEESARQFVQELANLAPRDVKNRSKWVENHLLATLSFANTPSSAGQARH